jgi:hypothetical protein
MMNQRTLSSQVQALQADLRQLERKRVYLQAKYGRPTAPQARAVDPDLAALERQRARLPQRSGTTGATYEKAMAEITLKRYQTYLDRMPDGSEGQRLLSRRIDQMKKRQTIFKREIR